MKARRTHILLDIAFVLVSVSAVAAVQQWKIADGFSMEWDTVTVRDVLLSPSIHYLHGSGGNMLVSSGVDGLLLVDNEFPEMTPKILAALQQIQPGPVKLLLNTHFHSDHTGGNATLGEAGTLIIAHDNARTRMLSEQRNLFFNSVTPASPQSAVPVVTFAESMTLHSNGEDVQFFHVGAAHTDGDAIVWFPQSNVIHMGDVYINGLYPIIDLAGGGNIDGYAPAIDAVLPLINDETKVVPGHGPVGSKAGLMTYRDMLVDIRNQVKAMIDAGMDIDAILAANPSKAYDNEWASDRVGPDDITMMTYLSLTGEYASML